MEKLSLVIEKELMLADRYYQNLCYTNGWRLAAVIAQAKYCRDSLGKAHATAGYTGRLSTDLWSYLVESLRIFLPLSLFAIVPISFYFVFDEATNFFTVTNLVKVGTFFSKPKYEVVPPPLWKPALVATIFTVIITACLSYLLKFVFKLELRYRRKALINYLSRLL